MAQTGDNLPALAVHFNTTVEEIRAANPVIPADATTLPPGFPMKIPIYSLPLWGSAYQIIPDELFVNGPAQVGFNTQAFIDAHPGWLKGINEFVSGDQHPAGEIIDLIAVNYSVSPRMLLALIEYMGGGLTQTELPADAPYYLGITDYAHKGLYNQLGWFANKLNNAYYDWRIGSLTEINLLDGRLERPDPWQNAATVAFHVVFSKLFAGDSYARAVSDIGLAKAYAQLFGDPWANRSPHIPGSLTQPAFRMPFLAGKPWAYTGGPHTGWGDEGSPLSAIDFAPPAISSGCTETSEGSTAVSDGIIVRRDPAVAVLDLDGDGDERTGWVVFYLHLASEDIIALNTTVKAGDPLGHPSCEGGHATGTHVHIARKYNGEWIPAGGVLAFNLEGWVVQDGSAAYEGTLVRGTDTIIANTASDSTSHIRSEVGSQQGN
ncbi:MAG TPA: LysM peptidoglycan-binding domain-containing protein [Anaerolineaceae bacterium]|nr:LysM peptidoglycan-binding domain-containing protein [Anaerolineaceae bacterium]